MTPIFPLFSSTHFPVANCMLIGLQQPLMCCTEKGSYSKEVKQGK